MVYPPVVVVDEHDDVIGAASLAEAWKKGLIHRIVFVIVQDNQGRILLHKRAPTMQLYAGRWDTAGGHVDVTPSYLETAKLELHEEVGIENVELTEAGALYTEDAYDNGVQAKRFIKIYRTHFDGEPGALGEDEVTMTRWFTKEEIGRLVSESPNLIAEGLYRCLPYILETYEDNRNQATS